MADMRDRLIELLSGCSLDTDEDARYVADKLIAADVAPVVTGRWELEGGDDDLDLYGWCSVCNRHWHEDLIDKFNYCPNCGAHMKDGE